MTRVIWRSVIIEYNSFERSRQHRRSPLTARRNTNGNTDIRSLLRAYPPLLLPLPTILHVRSEQDGSKNRDTRWQKVSLSHLCVIASFSFPQPYRAVFRSFRITNTLLACLGLATFTAASYTKPYERL